MLPVLLKCSKQFEYPSLQFPRDLLNQFFRAYVLNGLDARSKLRQLREVASRRVHGDVRGELFLKRVSHLPLPNNCPGRAGRLVTLNKSEEFQYSMAYPNA
jgi:hypothetical protein